MALCSRKGVAVDGHAGHGSTAFAKPIQELLVRCAIFLNGNSSAPQRELRTPAVNNGEQLAPRIRLGRNEPRGQTDFTQRRDRLRSAGGNASAGERRYERRAIPRAVDQRDQRACADTSQENDEVDLSKGKRINKRDRIGVAVYRDLTQRGRGNWRAPVIRDERRHLGAATALETEDTKSVE
jgi:hypothetical protein